MNAPWLFRLLAALPLPVAHGLGALLGVLTGLIPNKFTQLTRWHIRRCFPELGFWAREGLIWASLIEAGKAVLEGPILWAGPKQRVQHLVRETHGWDHVEAAIAAGKGVITAAPHLGAWEMAGLEYSRHFPITSLYKPQKGSWDALIRQGRERFGATLVPSDRGGVRDLLETLRAGKTNGILPDQDPPEGSGTFAPFFNITAHTPVLIPRLARRTGATVIYMYCERLSWGRGFILHFIPASPAVADADEATACTALNLGVEQCIRRHPAQYWWSYPRYRRQPQGFPDFYAPPSS